MNKEPKPVSNDILLHWSPQPVIDWLFDQARLIETQGEFVQQLADRLLLAQAPLDRLLVTLSTLNPQVAATSYSWLKSSGKTISFFPDHQIRQTDRYIGSPMQKLFETNKKVRQRLDQLPADAHLAYTELADDGFIDYLALPVRFAQNLGSALIIATKKAEGFSDHDIECFRRLRSFMGPQLEVFSLRHQLLSLMNTYVGHRTGQKILSGMIRRGDADTIHAALWFSDLRGLTYLSENLPAEQILALLNEYFEYVSAAVTARGGEILRFIGDAMLIVFPIDAHTNSRQACNNAVDAALDARATIATLNHQRRRHQQAEIRFGVGLNVGEVIYGNVGAPDRLDFTVMGPAVNRVARLETLTKSLNSDILFSKEFADLIEQPTRFLGEHEMKGITKAQAVYALLEQA